eukprot:scaffold101009_cov63-Phaeocystis_antarctica.AAC.3
MTAASGGVAQLLASSVSHEAATTSEPPKRQRWSQPRPALRLAAVVVLPAEGPERGSSRVTAAWGAGETQRIPTPALYDASTVAATPLLLWPNLQRHAVPFASCEPPRATSVDPTAGPHEGLSTATPPSVTFSSAADRGGVSHVRKPAPSSSSAAVAAWCSWSRRGIRGAVPAWCVASDTSGRAAHSRPPGEAPVPSAVGGAGCTPVLLSPSTSK